MIFNTLYKRGNTSWLVYQIETANSKLITRTGIEFGNLITKTKICKAKSIGRSNETTPHQQALKEAKALYKKMVERECYLENKLNTPHHVEALLARDYKKLSHQVDWSLDWYVQVKLDGIRAIHRTTDMDGNPIDSYLQSKKGVAYSALDKLSKQIDELRNAMELPIHACLDGEVYLHGVPLNRINGAAKASKDLTDNLEFHIFDITGTSLSYYERRKILYSVLERTNALSRVHIRLAPKVFSEAGLRSYHDTFVENGYEGAMLRGAGGTYEEGVRSAYLYKFKDFQDEEFEIVDVVPDEDGGGTLVYTSEHGEFNSRSIGSDSYRKWILDNKLEIIGKKGTIRFFKYTEFNIPQFPITYCIDPDK